jgi:Domain of unknown function (DUF397)
MTARKRLRVDEALLAGNSGSGWPFPPEVTAAMEELVVRDRRLASGDAEDRRPRYNPVAAVAAVLADMRLAGIEPPNLSSVEHDLAVMKAADLLTAMGVAPARPNDRDSRPSSGRAQRSEE